MDSRLIADIEHVAGMGFDLEYPSRNVAAVHASFGAAVATATLVLCVTSGLEVPAQLSDVARIGAAII